MKYLLVIIVLLFNVDLFSQIDTVYYDKKWDEIDNLKEAFFYRIGEVQKDSTYSVKDFYKSGVMQMEGQYKTIKSLVRIGKCVWFYDNGQKSKEAYYDENGDQIGTQNSWYSNGQKKSEKIYSKKGIRDIHKWDKNGAVLEVDTAIYTETYTVVESMPVFSEKCANAENRAQCTMLAIQKYAASVDYPMALVNNNIQGKLYIQYVVAKNGDVVNVKLLRGTNKYLDAIALEHIKNMPSFYSPGYQRGKAVRVQYNIPINFKLSDDNYKYSKKELKAFKQQLKEYELKFNKKYKN